METYVVCRVARDRRVLRAMPDASAARRRRLESYFDQQPSHVRDPNRWNALVLGRQLLGTARRRSDMFGQLGDGTRTNSSVPIQVF